MPSYESSPLWYLQQCEGVVCGMLYGYALPFVHFPYKNMFSFCLIFFFEVKICAIC